MFIVLVAVFRSLPEAVVREQHRGRGLTGMVGGVLREVSDVSRWWLDR